MFETLRELPLFRGVSYERISEVVSHIPFHFLKFPADARIVEQGAPCSHLMFLLSGSIKLLTVNADERFRISQTLHAPETVAPQCLFGRHQIYPFQATAITTTGLVQVAKNEYVKILHSDDVFLYNYLNVVCSYSQKAADGMLSITHGSLEERLAYWVLTLTQPSATDIMLQCKLRDLYMIFGVGRSAFVGALDRMKEGGLLDYDQTGVRFTDRPALVDLLHHVYAE